MSPGEQSGMRRGVCDDSGVSLVGFNPSRPPLVRGGEGFSEVVAAQFFHVRDADLAPLDDDQAGFGQFVQDAREVFLGEVEARGDGAFAGGQGDGERARVAFRAFA